MVLVGPNDTVLIDKKSKVCKLGPQEMFNLTSHTFSDFVKEASSVEGYEETNWLELEDIPWLQPSKLNEGVRFYNSYRTVFLQIMVLFVVGLLIPLKPAASIVFRDRSRLPDSKLYALRFVRKALISQKLIESIGNPEEAKREFHRVRKLHKLAAIKKPTYHDRRPLPEVMDVPRQPWMAEMVEAVRRDTIQNFPSINTKMSTDWNIPDVPVNQFDMLCVAMVIYSGPWFAPEYFGLKSNKDPKLKSVFQMCAVTCRMLGVRDEFNIFIEADPKTIRTFVAKTFPVVLANIDEFGVALQSNICNELQRMVPCCRYKPMVCLSVEMLFDSVANSGREKRSLGYPVQNIWRLLDWKDRICYYYLKYITWISGLNCITRIIANGWLQWITNVMLHELKGQ